MNADIFVQNIKKYCLLKGVKPTTACKESGVGASFISDINRGQTPSVAKVQLLAHYLDVTVSQLLGEDASEISQGQPHPYLVFRYNQLPKEDQEEVMAFVELKWAKNQRKKQERDQGSTP